MSLTAGILVAAVSPLLIGILIAGLPRGLRVGLWLQAAGTGAVAVAGLTAVGATGTVGASFSSGVHPSLGVDGLTAFFLATIAAAAVPALVYATRYLDGAPRARPIAMLSGLFVGALLLVVTARDSSLFLAGWELMTLVPASIMLVAKPDRPVRRAAVYYLAVTHLGGAGVWLSILLLSSIGGIGDPAALAAHDDAFRVVVWLAALVGFGTKAGLMPMHSWLPRAHPVAPAHVSALMSGVMIKVALYGLVRVLFSWTPAPPVWLGVIVLGLGALSAVGGVLYALFEHELKRLLAFHSIENVGIITLGLGASLLFASAGRSLWAGIAFAAALLHTLNHAVFKALLFLGAGAIERAVHGQQIDHLGGLLRRMPWTAGCFLVGSMAIAGLPPLNGFASEWLTLQALLHLPLDGASASWLGPLAAAALAATAALAVLCFVKVTGLALLGQPRHVNVARAGEVRWAMRGAQLTLAGLCLGLGLLPGMLLPALASLRPGSPPLSRSAGLDVPGTGGLPTVAIALALATLMLLAALARRGRGSAKPAPVWTCGQVVEPSLAWTSSAFTKPLRLMWEPVLRPGREITVHESGGIVQAVEYRGHVPHLFDTVLYAHAIRAALAVAERARRVQSGSLRSYAMYLGAMVVILLVLVRLGVLG